MIVSKLTRARSPLFNSLKGLNLRCGIGQWFDHMLVTPNYRSVASVLDRSYYSGSSFSNDNHILSSDYGQRRHESWPNLLFTDDWSEVDDNNTFWETQSDPDHTTIKNFSTFRFLFTPRFRVQMVRTISEELDLDPKRADIYLNFLRIKPILIRFDEMRFIRERRNLLRLLKKHLNKTDIIDSFELFSMQLRTAQFRVSFLRECGFKSLLPIHLIEFKKICSLSEITLKQMKLLDPEVNVIESLISQIVNLSDSESSQLEEKLGEQGLTLNQQYETIIAFLVGKLGYIRSVFDHKPHLRYLSIKGIKVFSKIMRDFDLIDSYASEDLRSLFEADPHNLESILTRVTGQFGEGTLSMLLKYPRILHTYASTLSGNLDLLLNRLRFTVEDIDYAPDCLMVETKDLQERFNHLRALFGDFPRSGLPLNLMQLESSELSDLLHEAKENGFSVTDLSSVYNFYSTTLKKTKFYPGLVPSHLRGLSRELGVPHSLIVATLQRHPHFHLTDNNKIKKTFNFIKSWEFISQEQLSHGLNLCLYDIEKVKEALIIMKQRDDYEEWCNHPHFLEALIYIIEKEYTFEDNFISDDKDALTETFDDLRVDSLQCN